MTAGGGKEPPELNVLGGPLEPCGVDPVTGFYRDGTCRTGPEDAGLHTVCAVVTREFLDHQLAVGNDLVTPRPEWGFPGLTPGDRWCVVAVRWLQVAERHGVESPLVGRGEHDRSGGAVVVGLQEHAVDVPPDAGSLL
ncbi:MAG: DUF2237 family protein [Actinomycetota bacterium]